MPSFRYHPDPVASGSVVGSNSKCRCCGRRRGFIYTGPVYAEDDLLDSICPWCIADGSAQAKYDAYFVDEEALPEGCPDYVMEEISRRTPGFCAYQQEKWPACCSEPAAFVGPAGIAEIRTKYRDVEGSAMSYIVYEMGISGGAARRLLESLNRDASPTAFVFRCTRCEQHMAYIDQT